MLIGTATALSTRSRSLAICSRLISTNAAADMHRIERKSPIPIRCNSENPLSLPVTGALPSGDIPSSTNISFMQLLSKILALIVYNIQLSQILVAAGKRNAAEPVGHWFGGDWVAKYQSATGLCETSRTGSHKPIADWFGGDWFAISQTSPGDCRKPNTGLLKTTQFNLNAKGTMAYTNCNELFQQFFQMAKRLF
nr:hypothetical protein Ccrd_025373 [Ipomoea trifida]